MEPKEVYLKIQIGDILKLKGNLRIPQQAANPGEFSYKNYLKNSNTFTTMFVMKDNFEIVKNPDDITVLTNKYLEIPDDYEPKDLVNMDNKYANNTYGQKQLRKEAYDAFVKMVDAAKEDGVTFYADSAYRSFSYQEKIYKNYVASNGQEKADKFAAKPGFSEHELGLAVDLANIWTITTKGEEYKWLTKHAHKYGYIFRYKEQWEDITGYSAESWHIRYVG